MTLSRRCRRVSRPGDGTLWRRSGDRPTTLSPHSKPETEARLVNLLIAIAAAVVLVWGLLFLFRGSLLYGGIGLLVVGYCFGHHFVNFELGPLPLTLDRILLGGLLVVYVLQRKLGLADPKPLNRTDVAMLAFAGVLCASTFAGDWRKAGPDDVSPLWLLVSGYLVPVALYFLARNSRVSDLQFRRTHAALAVFGSYLAATALAEITQQWSFVFPKYIADPELGIHYGRARGHLLQAHSLGLQLAMTLLCFWAWRSTAGKWGQLAFVLLCPVFAAAMFFTYTRCTWLGAGLGMLVVLAFWLRGTWRPLVLTATVGLGLLVCIFAWDDIVGLRRDAGAVAARDSVSQRASFTYVSWKMFLDRPLLGFGFGQFTEAKQPYLSDRSTPLYLEAIREQPHHNTFLSLLTETGLVGLGLYLMVLAGLVRSAWQMWRSDEAEGHVRTQGLVMLAALAIYLGPALFFDLAYSPNDHWILFFLAGLTRSLVPQAAASRVAVRRSQPVRFASPAAPNGA